MSANLQLLLLVGGLLAFPVSATADEEGEYVSNILPMRERVQLMEDW